MNPWFDAVPDPGTPIYDQLKRELEESEQK